MSKILDALRKVQGEASAIAIPLVDGAGSTRSAASIAPAEQHKKISSVQSSHQPTVVKAEPEQLIENIHVELLSHIIFHTEPTGVAADRFRLLRMRLSECWKAGQLKSVLVTSPLPGDGKSTTALNLVTALTEEKTRSVLLLDADLHRGSITHQLDLQRHAGLAECLHDGVNPLSVIRRVQPLGWYVLPSGQLDVASPTELLQPQELSSLFQKLSSQFDWIVVDSPPILPLSDAVALRQHTDGTLLIAKAGFTPKQAVNDAIALLGRKHILGLVLNGIEKFHQPYSSYYQYGDAARRVNAMTVR